MKLALATAVTLVVLAACGTTSPTAAPASAAPEPPDLRELAIQVRNDSHGVVTLAVVREGTWETIVGVAEPGMVPPRTTLVVRFAVPVDEEWVVLANGHSTIGSADVRGRDPGSARWVIDIDILGDARLQCRGDCP